MLASLRTPVLLSLALACLFKTPAVAQQQDMRECELTETGKIPLPDAGGLWYRRVGLVPEYATASAGPEWRQAGLYGNGETTRPTAHEAAGLAIAQGITPLDPATKSSCCR